MTAVVAVGGAIGALARYGVAQTWPTPLDHFPWTTVVINFVGCALMGVLMTTLKERFPHAPSFVNPLLGTGFLGGFSTFSHFIDGSRLFFRDGQIGYAFGNIFLTVVTVLAGVVLGVLAARAFFAGPGRLSRDTTEGTGERR